MENVPINVPINEENILKEDENISIKEQILFIIRNNGSYTTTQMAEILGTNRKTVQRNINELRKMGLITREGSNKRGHWKIN